MIIFLITWLIAFFSFVSFRFYVSLKYAKYLISQYKAICENLLNSVDILDRKSDLLTTEIISMDHALDYINRSLASNPFKMLSELKESKRGDK